MNDRLNMLNGFNVYFFAVRTQYEQLFILKSHGHGGTCTFISII